MYWNKTIETMDPAQMRQLQETRLCDLVKRLYSGSEFYRNRFQEQGILPEDITKLEDLAKLPFTVKQDLRDTYPYGMFAVPASQIVRIHASSGTTGKPIVVGYTKKDIGIWSEVMARAYTSAGINKHSVVQIAYGYGLFTGGLGAHYGAETVGASVIPISVGSTNKQVALMCDFGTTAIACTPSYALYIAETMREMGIDPKSTNLKTGLFGAEPWSEKMRDEIEKQLGISAHDIYGLSEIIGPGVACECEYKNGGHIYEDHFYPEIINPVTGEVLPIGEKGELVLTTLTKEGIPMVRYRTKDLTTLNREVCDCGRTLVRMGKILGRSDDMLIIRGLRLV